MSETSQAVISDVREKAAAAADAARKAIKNRKTIKNIVLCSDGTGNRGGKVRGTNVWRTYKAVDRRGYVDPQGQWIEQITLHDDGVGTEKFKLVKAVTGAFGLGLSRNIRDLYTFLVKTYNPGDRIYLFGFSRGAFTVRALGGMICKCGVLRRNAALEAEGLETAVKKAYKAYKDTSDKTAQGFKATHKVYDEVPIKFIGVWDTVDAVGVPFDELRETLARIPFFNWRFPNHDLNPLVENGCHAVSIDDERKTFHPVMWSEEQNVPNQKIEQVWFSGVHSNVGGGYPREELALVALDWMMAKAEDCGLRFAPGTKEEVGRDANVHGKLYDSRSGPAAYYRYAPRDIKEICSKHGIATPKIHRSVFERIARRTADYAPAYIPGGVEVPLSGHENQSVKDEVASIQAQLSDKSDQDRVADLEESRPFVLYRKILYVVLLMATLFTLVLGGFLMRTPPSGGTPEWLMQAVKTGAGALAPDFVSNLIGSLAEHPYFVIGVAVLLGALLFIRGKLEGAMRRICIDAWKAFCDSQGFAKRSDEGQASAS